MKAIPVIAPIRVCLAVMILGLSCQAQVRPRVLEVPVDGVIHPVTTEILKAAVLQASVDHDALLLLRIDTPGGLMQAMRDCIQVIIASPVPVIAYVGPHGARAASAGFFLLQAADLAAMASGTNTGAAHPVIMGTQMDPVMKEKLENDAAATLRSLTLQRGRNVALAETAVRQSKSFTSREALDSHLIEVLASSEADLLHQVDGRAVSRFDGTRRTLHLTNAEIVQYQPTLRQRILSGISDPNVALVLLALGILGIYVEFTVPGLILPGVAGAISALLGLAAFALLPLNWLGVGLLLLGFGLFGLELKFASHGLLSVGGSAALVFGAVMLVDSPIPEMRIHLSTALAVTVPLVVLSSLLVMLALRARRNKVVTGAEGMIGQIGVALEDLHPEGNVLVHGEYWQARAAEAVPRGARVRVDGIAGLRLRVTSIQKSDSEESG